MIDTYDKEIEASRPDRYSDGEVRALLNDYFLQREAMPVLVKDKLVSMRLPWVFGYVERFVYLMRSYLFDEEIVTDSVRIGLIVHRICVKLLSSNDSGEKYAEAIKYRNIIWQKAECCSQKMLPELSLKERAHVSPHLIKLLTPAIQDYKALSDETLRKMADHFSDDVIKILSKEQLGSLSSRASFVLALKPDVARDFLSAVPVSVLESLLSTDSIDVQDKEETPYERLSVRRKCLDVGINSFGETKNVGALVQLAYAACCSDARVFSRDEVQFLFRRLQQKDEIGSGKIYDLAKRYHCPYWAGGQFIQV